MQNDFADLPLLLEKINEDYDVVCGWRENGQDKLLSHWSHDWCEYMGQWVFIESQSVICHKRVWLYGDLHRFIPAVPVLAGARIEEISVTHRPGKFVESKYGIGHA